MNSSSTQGPRFGLIWLLITAVLLAIIGSLLEDARGVPYGAVAGFLWVAALLLTFAAYLLYYARLILPKETRESWSEGLRLLWRHYISDLVAFPESVATSSLPLPHSFRTLRAGIVRSHHVLALTKNGGFSRAAGPGFVMLYPDEEIAQVIDLREHLRSLPLRVNTRDGIPLDARLTVTFRVRRYATLMAPAAVEDEPLYPYDTDAIFDITYMRAQDEEGNLLPWTEQICPPAVALAVTEMARYTLDQLFTQEDGDRTPLDTIRSEVKRRLERHFTMQGINGIELIRVGISRLSVPPEIMQQRLRKWQANWQSLIHERQVATDAEMTRRLKNARARAQIDIIDTITQNIDAMRSANGADLTEIITLRMIEALEDALENETVRALIPQHMMTSLVMDTSRQLQSWLTNPPQESQ